MNALLYRLKTPILLTLVIASVTLARSSRANVYASNIKVNGTLTNSATTSQGSSVAISYILNEAATAGVTINISSNGTTVRTISIPSGTGTAKGLNTVNWDGKDGSNNNVATGTYSVSITAAATGFTDWTVTSDTTSPTTYSYRPYGIAVDKNTNSPYYGRVFIANATTNKIANPTTGDVQGIIKCNADGSYADDGAFSRFDYAWVDDGGDSPILLQHMGDDNLYFNDWTGKGKVVGVDSQLTHSFVVWGPSNYVNTPVLAYTTNGTPIPANFVDFDIAFIGTDHPFLFATDNNFPSDGVYGWFLTNNAGHLYADPSLFLTNEDGSTKFDGTAGQQVIQVGGDLGLRADGIQVDLNTNLYVVQNRANLNDPATRAMMFPAWDGVTDLFTGAAWNVGGADNTFRAIRGCALDSRANPTKLAVPSYINAAPDPNNGNFAAGGIRILDPATGNTIQTNLFSTNYYRAVSWDNVGNLYAGTSGTVGGLRSRWQQISPPGANQATTAALVSIQVTASAGTPPHITSISYNGGTVTINFTADSSDLPTSFTLQSSGVVTGPYGNVIGTVATANGGGSFTFTTLPIGTTQFYRISR